MSAGTKLPRTPEPTHYLTGFGGLRIVAGSLGDQKGPLVLLQHGGGQTRHAWKGTGEVLGAASYYVVAFDARGHGDSEWVALQLQLHLVLLLKQILLQRQVVLLLK